MDSARALPARRAATEAAKMLFMLGDDGADNSVFKKRREEEPGSDTDEYFAFACASERQDKVGRLTESLRIYTKSSEPLQQYLLSVSS